jgi:prephenate dehydrogenase
LFEGARVYLCPGDDTPASAVDRAASLWRWLGAVPASMRADEHDRHLAWTSHLPHIISTTLALALADGRVRRDDLGPGGRDMTRLAGSSAEMWTAIAGENAAAIDAALAAAERHLAEFRDLLQRPDAASLHQRFSGARAWFEG